MIPIKAPLIYATISATPAFADVYIGGVFDRSGDTTANGIPYSDAIIDYIKYVNKFENGINGEQINFIWKDYGYKIPRAFQVYKSLTKKEKPQLIFGWGTGDTTALSHKITKDQIPYISGSYADTIADGEKTPYNFFVGVSYNDQMKIAMKYIKQNHKGTEPPNVVLMYPDNGFGRSTLSTGFETAKKLNVKISDKIILGIKEKNASEQVLKTKNLGADYIILQSISNSTINLVRALHKTQNSHIKVLTLNWGFMENLYTQLGANSNGVMGTVTFSTWDDDHLEGIKFAKKIRKKLYNSDKFMPLAYIQGLASAYVGIEAIRRSVKNKSTVKEGLETMNNFDMKGLTPPVTFTSKKHNGITTLKIKMIKDNKVVTISDTLDANQ